MPPVPEPDCKVQTCFTAVLTSKPVVNTPLTSYKRQLSIHNLPQKVKEFVTKSAALCQPEDIHIMDGSESENQWLLNKLTNEGTLIKLSNHKNCYLTRTDPKDVARVESRTFICSSSKRNSVCTPQAINPSSPTPKSSLGNFMPLDQADEEIQSRFPGCMKGRVMYVIPFSMGPIGGPLSKIGVQVTDSAYVATSMRIMTRLGTGVVDQLEKDAAKGSVDFVKCLHSVGKCDEATTTWPCDPERVLILHKPETNEIVSYGSGYGGNSLLGKKCFALRIGSTIAQKEGWLAEHMLILGITPPSGKKVYIAAAFPSACGKTNLAMMNPSLPGYKVECIGDDIAWIKYNPKTGMLHAINPENGFFGVAPGTNWKTNPNAMKSMTENTLFTNVALTSNGSVWWEGMEDPAEGITITDWRGRPWVKGETKEPAAHPNSRFTAPCSQCPIIDPDWESPEGVPLSAVLFGGRRPQGVPLVFEALNWEHGVLIGASMRSEATAAASDVTAGSRLLHDPFAMRPFFGYNFGKYLEHWLSMKTRFGPEAKLPKIFHVNWFRKDSQGKFLWPGFGDNIRVLDWVINRLDVSNDANAIKTPIGFVPREEAINLDGLSDTKRPNMKELLSVPKEFWSREVEDIENYLKEQVNIDLPEKIMRELTSLKQRLN